MAYWFCVKHHRVEQTPGDVCPPIDRLGPYDSEADATRALEKAVSPEYLAQLIEAYNYYFYHYDETPLLVVDTNEIDFVNRPGDFEDLVGQIQKAKKGVQYYVPAASAPK